MTQSRAQSLRQVSTPAERRMWRLLYPFRVDGFHFRKQVANAPYFADFACHHAGLVIEVDGNTHFSASGQKHGQVRDDYLRRRGYKVMRLLNEDVMKYPEGVYNLVSAELASRPRNLRSPTSD